jgi:hypothetical protein
MPSLFDDVLISDILQFLIEFLLIEHLFFHLDLGHRKGCRIRLDEEPRDRFTGDRFHRIAVSGDDLLRLHLIQILIDRMRRREIDRLTDHEYRKEQ